MNIDEIIEKEQKMIDQANRWNEVNAWKHTVPTGYRKMFVKDSFMLGYLLGKYPKLKHEEVVLILKKIFNEV